MNIFAFTRSRTWPLAASRGEHMKPELNPEIMALSVEEASRATSLGRTKIFELLRTGRIRGVKIGARTVIPVESIRALLAKD
jgi:excisionase family DNA binding protein